MILRGIPNPSPRVLFIVVFLFIIISTTTFLATPVGSSSLDHVKGLYGNAKETPPAKEEPPAPKKPEAPPPDVKEIFPAAAAGAIPALHPLNKPPKDAPYTPLFIGFTRNWPILQQAVVSYIASGWPASHIYIVDNSGVMDSNSLGLLTLQNPFYMNYTRLEQLGVNVLTTPTLFTFAQLQNYFLYHAISQKWKVYWWSHMDTVAVAHEDRKPYKNLWQLMREDWDEVAEGKGENEKWGVRFFYYDRLALVNVEAYKEVGGWDTHIPFYHTDCDMHSRLMLKGYSTPSKTEKVGLTYDVGGTVKDLSVFFPAVDEELGGERWKKLTAELSQIQGAKGGGGGRNFWQAKQQGGKGEPFYKDPNVSPEND